MELPGLVSTETLKKGVSLARQPRASSIGCTLSQAVWAGLSITVAKYSGFLVS